MGELNLVFLPVGMLKPHELVDAQRRKKVMAEIVSNEAVHPIIASKECVILDGHHRHACLASLGVRLVPAFVVDYSDGSIRVSPRRGIRVSKKSVTRRGLAGLPFPPKTTRHEYSFELPPMKIPLSSLK